MLVRRILIRSEKMTGPASLLVIVLSAELAESFAQNNVGKCCSNCDCQGYSLAGGVWTKESCCKSGNPCWCDQKDQCQPSCSSSSQEAPLGRCYTTKNCQQYSRAGGFWSKSDCCTSGGLCWCDQTEKCQLSCSISTSPSTTATLGKCYSTRDCQSYSVAGGKWTQMDCCSSGGRCWCDQYGRCQPSCSASANQQVTIDNLGKCYSTRDCQQYSAAGGKWTKQDCCSSGSNCWCDPNRRCQPSCSNLTNRQSPLGGCYSTRDCQRYSMAGGSWTKKDCCLSSGLCWCDTYGRCQPTCSTTTPQQPDAVTALGKCYSTRDCRSYSKAGGSWTKADCCLTGGLCWCDLNQVCQPSCSSTVSTSEQVPTQTPEKRETPSSTTPATTHATTKLAHAGTNFPIVHTEPITVHTFAHSTLPPSHHTKPSLSTLGKCYATYDCQPKSVANGLWTIEHCCLSGNLCWCDLHKQCQPSCVITQNFISETRTASFEVSTGSKLNHTKSRNMMYLWLLLLLVVVCPCLCCIWFCCCYKGRTNNLNFTYIKVNADPDPSAPSPV